MTRVKGILHGVQAEGADPGTQKEYMEHRVKLPIQVETNASRTLSILGKESNFEFSPKRTEDASSKKVYAWKRSWVFISTGN